MVSNDSTKSSKSTEKKKKKNLTKMGKSPVQKKSIYASFSL